VRVVFDTNTLVSALVLPGGRAAVAVHQVVRGPNRLVISRPIIREVLDVLARKFDRNPEELARTAVFQADLGDVVRPRRTIATLRDEPDNRVLECAVAGRANAIVTGDRAMLELGAYEGIAIMSLKDFLGHTP